MDEERPPSPTDPKAKFLLTNLELQNEEDCPVLEMVEVPKVSRCSLFDLGFTFYYCWSSIRLSFSLNLFEVDQPTGSGHESARAVLPGYPGGAAVLPDAVVWVSDPPEGLS